jgi:hypothetical protein
LTRTAQHTAISASQRRNAPKLRLLSCNTT